MWSDSSKARTSPKESVKEVEVLASLDVAQQQINDSRRHATHVLQRWKRIAMKIPLSRTAGNTMRLPVLLILVCILPAAPFAPQSPARQSTASLWASTTSTTPSKLALSPDERALLFGNEDDRRDTDTVASRDTPIISTTPHVMDLVRVRQELQACPLLWKAVAQVLPNAVALIDEHLCDTEKVRYTFSQVDTMIRNLATHLATYRTNPTEPLHVALFAENSARWLLTDHAVQLLGGVSAVRGAAAPLAELRYIYEHADAQLAVLQGPNLMMKLHKDAQRIQSLMPLGLGNDLHGGIQTVVLLNREKKTDEELAELSQELGLRIVLLSNLTAFPAAPSVTFPTLTPRDLATIVYTSGTTGNPKGVMLSHGNLLHQTHHRLGPSSAYDATEPLPGETMVSLLPVWHITERTFELWMLLRGCQVVYSTVRTFKKDLAKYQPEWLVLVPRVLEKIGSGVQDKFAEGSLVAKGIVKLATFGSRKRAKHSKRIQGRVVDQEFNVLQRMYSRIVTKLCAPINLVGDKLVWRKVQAGFGGKLRLVISGGSALSGGLEEFYETAGIPIVVGYGLTECSPLLSFRRSDANLVAAGCAGIPAGDTRIRIVDEASRQSVPTGQIGVVLGKGPQVMQGYYKNEEATKKAIDEYGWFDTGDLGRFNTVTGDLILTGRAKDTIVLSNGENIEPGPIEDAILGSTTLTDQIMLTGQDGRRLVAVCVLNPTELANRGFFIEADLQRKQDIVNDPLCTEEDYQNALTALTAATNAAAKTEGLVELLTREIAEATKGFRSWEQVGGIYVTMEPFAMVNGLLTQSYKVKRPAVQARYANELKG